MIAQSTDKGWRPEAPPLQGRGLGWGLSNAQLDELHRRAAEMRRNPTEPEKRLWRQLSDSQLDGHKFRRQSVIGRFIADFVCSQKALIVEVDGNTHEEGKDRLRDDILAKSGFRVVRVTNDEVMTNIDGVLQHILIALNEAPLRWNNPHPNPSPEGEGLRAAKTSPPLQRRGRGWGLSEMRLAGGSNDLLDRDSRRIPGLRPGFRSVAIQRPLQFLAACRVRPTVSGRLRR